MLHQHLRRHHSNGIIWTAGDSSLDNKYWFRETAPAINGYESILQPPRMKQDVTYWLNEYCHTRSTRMAAINTAVEATTLNERTIRLRPQDEFVRDHIQAQDVLIVSVGGNDVALCPSPCTILSLLGLVKCCPTACIDRGVTCGTIPCDDHCWGCGPSCASCLCGMPPCLGYLRHLFGTRLHVYIERLVAQTKPHKILVCMIYHPDETTGNGWAEPALRALGYNQDPVKLQAVIAKMMEQAISRISIPGTQVIPVPLYRVLNGKDSSDYVLRVEPSPQGGRKMAEYFLDVLDRPATMQDNWTAPQPFYIRDRDLLREN